MSVTETDDDGIPHGLKGYRKPYNCRGPICAKANSEYMKAKRAEYANKDRDDELAAKREARKTVPPISTAGMRKRSANVRAKNGTESPDSVKPGEMEKAVIEECAAMPEDRALPTKVIAARKLARIVDNGKLSSMHNSTTKQLMAIMAEMRGDDAKSRATGRRKSGSRMATVGNLTKVKRAQ